MIIQESSRKFKKVQETSREFKRNKEIKRAEDQVIKKLGENT